MIFPNSQAKCRQSGLYVYRKSCAASLGFNGVEFTDHEVNNAGEEYGRDRALSDDVRQDLRQEVDGHSVISTCVFMTAKRET